jgi:hypothetical protein
VANASRRRVLALAAAMGALAFAFRLVTLRDLTNDHYMHLAWAQQLLFGELPGRDFVDPGMPLMYALSAMVQRLWHGPFSEGVLTCLLLGVAASATFLVVTELVGSIVFGAGATLFQIALEPRLYSYPKILVPAVALLLLQLYLRQPSRMRLVGLAAWTGVSVLLRHDLGVYAAAGVGAALLVAHANDWRRAVRVLVEYSVALVALMLPYVVFVQWSEGLGEHLHEAIEFTKGEAHQRFMLPPGFPFWSVDGSGSWSRMDAAVFLFYAAHALAILCLVLLGRSKEHPSRNTPVAAAGFTMLLMYLLVVLRHPIDSRIQDVAALLAINGAWALAQSWQRAGAAANHAPRSSVRRIVPLAVAVALVAGGTANTWILAGVPNRLKETRVLDGVGAIKHTVEVVKETGTVWPWERYWPAGELPAVVRYVNACTTRDDALLLTWAAPEYYYFTQRRFGAGHALFLPPDAFTTAHDQLRMLERIRNARIPLVLIIESRNDEFATAYPEVERYIRDAYVPVGEFDIRDGSRVAIAVSHDFKGSGTYGSRGWPCGFARRAASNTASIMLDGSAMPLPAMSNAVPWSTDVRMIGSPSVTFTERPNASSFTGINP